MNCQACGWEQGWIPEGTARFCSRCGTVMSMQAQPMYMPLTKAEQQRARLDNNVQPLGITWCVYAAFRFLRGLAAGAALHRLAVNGTFDNWFAPHLLNAMAPAIAGYTAVLAVLSFVTGWALLTRKPWARVLALVMGSLSLLRIPVGTGVGIYTLWVLAPRAAGEQYRRTTDRWPMHANAG